jgi:DNA-binding PadR family transcriptional regulator
MQTSYLEIIHFLGDSGYYARTSKEKRILSNLTEKGLLQIKKGTKNVYQLTPRGVKVVNRGKQPIKDYSDTEFLKHLEDAYRALSNPMKPLVRIPDVREKLNSIRISDSFFDKKLLSFHDQGILTLQTAMSKTHAEDGGILSDTGTGVFYYLTFEA